jgi:hypothetical protein
MRRGETPAGENSAARFMRCPGAPGEIVPGNAGAAQATISVATATATHVARESGRACGLPGVFPARFH